MRNHVVFLVFITLFIVVGSYSFRSLPRERLSPFTLSVDEKYENGVYSIAISNPVKCPIRFYLSSDEKAVTQRLESSMPFLLSGLQDTVISLEDHGDLTGKMNINIKWGDPSLKITTDKLDNLPFLATKKYKLLQGNNSSPTHNTTGNRYAFDFTMSIGDTVTAAQDGNIVGVVAGYSGWGAGNRWKPFGNQIIIYHPESHLFTQYGHLNTNGSLVEVGDQVKAGDPIGISGKTGQTTEPHLHFNVYQSDNSKSGLRSFQLDSLGKYKVGNLKRYQWMEQ